MTLDSPNQTFVQVLQIPGTDINGEVMIIWDKT